MSHRPHRPLALFSALAVADYALWNWSLNNGHDVVALIAGLTLLPIGAVAVWLLTLAVARALARSTRRRAVVAPRRLSADAPRGQRQRAAGAQAIARVAQESATSVHASGRSGQVASPSRKLAA